MLRSPVSRWVAGTVALCFALLLGTWFLLIAPRSARADDLDDQNLAAHQQNDLLQIKLTQLRAEYEELPAQRTRLASILTQMPAQADMATFVRETSALAAASGVSLTGIVPGTTTTATGTAASGTAASGTAASGSTASGSDSGTASGGTASGTQDQRSTSSSQGTTSQSGTSSATSGGTAAAGATIPSGGLVEIPLTVTVVGDYFKAVTFLKKLQQQSPRAVLVRALSVQVQDETSEDQSVSGVVQMTIDGVVFALPSFAAQASATAGSSGTSGSTGSTSATPSPAPGTTGTGTSATPSVTGTQSTNGTPSTSAAETS